MEMTQISSLVERLTDEQLMQEIQKPSGMAPLQIVMGELQRRAALRGGKPRGYAAGGMIGGPADAYEAEIARLFPHLVQQESGGQAGILGPQTRYGQAQGRTQMLPATARQMAERIGVPWRPEMMTGRTEEAASYQDRLGMEYLREGFSRTGNARDALRYYHGGPDRGIWGRNTNRYADEVLARAGETAPPPPAVPGLTGADGFSNPQNIANDSMSIGARIAESLGLGGGLGSIQEMYGDVSEMMPDATAPYAEVLQRLQGEEGRERGANRGRALMDAGLAMMSARTPNFMSALAAGGQAGLASRDRIQEEERGLMQSVIQAQLARSQAEQQQARASLEAASGLFEGNRRSMATAQELGSGLALGGARSQDSAAETKARVDQANIELRSREREGALDRINRLEGIREQVIAQAQSDANPERVYQTLLNSALGRVGERIMVPGVGGKPPTMSVYSREDAIRDAREGTSAAMAFRASGGSTPPAAGAGLGGAGGPQIISVDGQPVSAPAAAAPPARPAAPAPPARNLPALSRGLGASVPAAPARSSPPLSVDHDMRSRAIAERQAREAAEAAQREREAERLRIRRQAMRPSGRPATTGPRPDQAMIDRYGR